MSVGRGRGRGLRSRARDVRVGMSSVEMQGWAGLLGLLTNRGHGTWGKEHFCSSLSQRG